jgi:hypothetical protein
LIADGCNEGRKRDTTLLLAVIALSSYMMSTSHVTAVAHGRVGGFRWWMVDRRQHCSCDEGGRRSGCIVAASTASVKGK